MSGLAPELLVADLDLSLAFYVAAGFKVVHDRPEERFVYLRRGDADLMLEEVSLERATKDVWWLEAPLERPLGRGVNFQIEVADLDSVAAGLARAGFGAGSRRTASYIAGDRVRHFHELMVSDPDGYRLRFQMEVRAGASPR